MTIIGQRIKSARKNKNLSQTELALLLGVSQPTIGNWESGNHEPRHAITSRIAYALDVRHLWLISGMEAPVDGDSLATPVVGEQGQYLTTPIVHVPVLEWPISTDNFLKDTPKAQRYLPASLWALQPFALEVCDDSMVGEFAQGALVIFDAARTRLYDGELYLFNWNGIAILRRWRTNPGRLEASGDSSNFPSLFTEENPIVIARALQSIRELA
ncbi:MAG: helix-turn-helix domain-containing protein [Robiginitomaculum sp.]|nr:helix-turn-helix domain-containing protein [Robiginitomaculum sp.]